MRFNFRHGIVLGFGILLIFMLSSKTTWRLCTVCGVQDFERSLFGTTVEWISEREVDEYGTHAKWKAKYGQAHAPHQWVEIDERSEELKRALDNLEP